MNFIPFFSATVLFLMKSSWLTLLGITRSYSWTLLGTEITITLNALMLKQVLGQITKPVTLRMQVEELVEGKFEYIY